MEAHMVSQTIKYSDGTETVINYRGKIVNGVLIPDEKGSLMGEELNPAVESPVEAPQSEPVSDVPAVE